MACAELLFEDRWRYLSVIPEKELEGERKTESVELGLRMVADDMLWNVTLSSLVLQKVPKLLYC